MGRAKNSAKRRLRRPNKSAAKEEEDDAVDALLRFAPPRFVVVQTFAKRVLDESVDVVEIDVVIVIAKKNEINNGRWTMFGLLVGMMTEYATGVDFIDQIKLLVNVLGIADLD